MRIAPVSILLASCCLVAGCHPTPVARPKGWYTGETEPMREVVQQINDNNQELPTLWASHGYKATVVDERGKSHTFTGDGAILYRGPREMRLIGNAGVVGNVFEVGSTNDRFWLKLVPELDTMWWGHYRNLGKPCAQAIPLRPDLVVEVLGVSTINPDFNQLPVPVMRFNHGADAYMFVWNKRSEQNDRWIAVKEVWYDRATFRPKAVILFDENGRVTLEAMLSKPIQVDAPNTDRAAWPTIASEYRLFFPDPPGNQGGGGSRLLLRLSDPALKYKGLPNDGTFRFNREAGDGVAKVIQLDEACAP